MIDHLQTVVIRLEHLSPAEQETIATQLEELLEEYEWDALVQTPEAQIFHQKLREEARQAEQAGELEEIEGDDFA